MSEIRPTVEQLSGDIKTYKFVEFTSQPKTGLSSVERIYPVCGILENAKTCLYGYKTDNVFETNPIPYIMLLSRDENLWSICFLQRYKIMHIVAMIKVSGIADSESFLELWSKQVRYIKGGSLFYLVY